MSVSAIIVVGILAGTIALFVSDRLRLDVVALLSLLALWLTGSIDTKEGLAGFSDPVVLMIAGLFVVGTALFNSGVASWLGSRLEHLGGSSEVRLTVVIMLASALLSAFMSSTGTVAILLPVVVAVAKRKKIPPSQLLIPLAFASLLGGMLTLIGTPPNLVANAELRRHGAATFGFFSFTPAGLVMLVVGIAFMAFLGRRLLPGRRGTEEAGPRSLTQDELAADYQLRGKLHTARITDNSDLVGMTLRDAALRQRYGVNVLGVRRADGDGCAVLPTLLLAAGDQLRLQCDAQSLEALAEAEALQTLPDRGDMMLPPTETMAELVVPRRSRLVGKTLRQVHFRDRFRATALAIQRRGDTLTATPGEVQLQAGDIILVKGSVNLVRLLGDSPQDFVLLTETKRSGEGSIDRTLGPRAIAITLGMLVLMTASLVPNVVAVLLAAVAMVLSRCLTAQEAYRRINWESVVVIAAILPMATALDKSGAMGVMVNGMVARIGPYGPVVMMAALFLVTSTFSQVISNTATTVLVAPIAFRVATELGLTPHAFLMTVAIAASTAFATPIASPVNTLVLNAGGYRFGDFLKVGVALQLLLLVATLLIVPLLFPLTPL
jgi:di/tricarboxylate transporter